MFSKGKYYPHYKSDSVYRNSKYNGKQCYLCKVCKYTLDRIKKFLSEGSIESIFETNNCFTRLRIQALYKIEKGLTEVKNFELNIKDVYMILGLKPY